MLAPVTELSTPDAETDPWLSDDSHRIYFSSDRLDAGFDLFVAEREN